MHTDARTLPDGTLLEGDLCIVGAGAAGIALALEFVQASTRVILLEGGGFDLDGPVQALYRGEIVGRPYYPLEGARLHYFGGTTGHWGGYCAPFDSIDFAPRAWVPHSGWPITRSQLDPFYARAHPVLDLGPYEYDPAAWVARDPTRAPLPLDPSIAHDKVWQFSPPTRFGSKYRDALVQAPNVHLYTYANVVEVEANESVRTVDTLRVRQFDGRELRVRARHVVLACSTMQNVRLLLASNARATAGLGNGHDLVGRYFMEHLEMPAGKAVILQPQSLAFYAFDFGRTTMRAELRLSDAEQERQAILNGTVSLEPSAASGSAATTFELEPPEELEAYRQATRDGIGDDMRSPPSRHDAAAVAARPYYDLVTRQEQAPNPASRVTLSTERDALGVPRARFDWQFTALDKRSMRALYLTLGREFGRRGIGRVQLREWLLTDDESWPSFVSGGWHDMGGTRMHDNPKQGVVDADCRVHGLSNLHIAGAGVFPTAGAANPTLTIVAMALRLADRLKGLLS